MQKGSTLVSPDRPALTKRRAAHPAEPEPEPVQPQPLAAGSAAPGSGVVFAVRVPPELRKRYRLASARLERPMQDMVIEALDQYITQLGG
jgi:hypothetical protein